MHLSAPVRNREVPADSLGQCPREHMPRSKHEGCTVFLLTDTLSAQARLEENRFMFLTFFSAFLSKNKLVTEKYQR